MQLKLFPMLAGVIASFSLVVGIPVAAKAEPPAQPSPITPGQGQSQSPLAGVKLTQQQQDRINQIRSNTRARIQKVLTTEQQNRYQAALQSGQGRQAAVAAMNLSDNQKKQLQQIVQSARTQTNAVFTPEQRRQIQQNIQQMRPQNQ
ncbi:MAG: Spy/CpxP family protein refolding chaperone [Chroococcidiopsidaceae cyanobacterium CP_BM_RX_35]|nr:Spy/CpxP family protein refolding chaperone [Chroococcidiopsidaceae cyanobacterium CP_BM_RX_35]